MPFKSEKQRRFLYANEPALAKRWAHKYGNRVQALHRRLKKHGTKKDDRTSD